MKKLLSISMFVLAHSLTAQSLTGIWHGQLFDTSGEVINYLNLSIEDKGGQLVATPRVLNKETNSWEPVKGKTSFVSVTNNAILSRLSEGKKWSESEVYVLSYISPKRIAVNWINQVNNTDTPDNKVWTKQGAGYLEPFLDGIMYENLSIGGTSTNRVSIDNVEVAQKATVITFSYHNTSFEPVLMRLSKPGTNGAYFLTPLDRSHKYNIIDKINIAYEPDNTTVAPNSFHTFKIYFEPIPETLKSFSILEGETEIQSGKEWNFYDIQLK